MTRRFLTLLPGLGLLAGVAACSSPATRYYTLAEHPADGVVIGAAPAASPRLGVYVADVAVPDSTDRQPLVIARADNGTRVQVQEFDQWAAPLDGQVTRVVVGNLRQLLGVSTVASDLDLVGNPRALRLRLVVERFEGSEGGRVMVRARWSIARPARGDADKALPPRVDSVSVERPVGGPGVDGVVNAWNDALWEVSQAVARDLVAADRS